jgi:hypothetical protein
VSPEVIRLFTEKHLWFLAASVIYIVLASILARRYLSLRQVLRIFLGIGIVSEIIKIFYFVVTNDNGNYLPATDLPFHLCSIQIIFIVMLNMSRNERLRHLLLAFMLPTCLFGGIASLAIPTWSSIHGLLLIGIQYFTYHATLIVFSIYLYRSSEVAFTVRDYRDSLVFLGCIGFAAIYINGILGRDTNVNFMYVVRPPMDGLPYLNLDQGWIMYIIKYSSLAILLLTLSYIGPIVRAIKSRFFPPRHLPKSQHAE